MKRIKYQASESQAWEEDEGKVGFPSRCRDHRPRLTHCLARGGFPRSISVEAGPSLQWSETICKGRKKICSAIMNKRLKPQEHGSPFHQYVYIASYRTFLNFLFMPGRGGGVSRAQSPTCELVAGGGEMVKCSPKAAGCECALP